MCRMSRLFNNRNGSVERNAARNTFSGTSHPNLHVFNKPFYIYIYDHEDGCFDNAFGLSQKRKSHLGRCHRLFLFFCFIHVSREVKYMYQIEKGILREKEFYTYVDMYVSVPQSGPIGYFPRRWMTCRVKRTHVWGWTFDSWGMGYGNCSIPRDVLCS